MAGGARFFGERRVSFLQRQVLISGKRAVVSEPQIPAYGRLLREVVRGID